MLVLNLEFLRGRVPAADQIKNESRLLQDSRRLTEKQREWLQNRDRRIANLEKRLEAEGLDTPASAVNAANIVWIFGTMRTGSTWLGSMMGKVEGHALWNEPLVGALFGEFFQERSAHHREKSFVMGLDRKPVWLESVRRFVLDAVGTKYDRRTREGYLVVKEPSGSVGAPLIMEAIPESRMVFLIRDPRDVVASILDATKRGSWLHEWSNEPHEYDAAKSSGKSLPDEISNGESTAFVEKQARVYLHLAEPARQAYEAHEGPKALLRYEDLREDTLNEMKRLYTELEMTVDEEELARVVEEHSWENIPEERKGEGKFFRKGEAGGWRKDLTAEQIEIIEEITAPLLQEFYAGHK